MAARLVLLATSPRVAPGLLTADAWSVLRVADTVLVGSDDHSLLPALVDVGVPVRVLAPPAPDGADPDSAEPDDVEARPDRAVPDGADRADARAMAILAELRRPDEHGVPDRPVGSATTDHTVVWLMSAEGDPGLAAAIARAVRAEDDVAVEVLAGSWDLPGARLLDLVAVMDLLRSPGGCPWDAEQTHSSLVEYLVEEAYETVEAIEVGGDADLREELGDLLLQIVFHARLAEEHEQPWGIDEVATGIVEKLVARHPHVFGDDVASSADEVEATWARRKLVEKGRSSVTDGVPLALPSLVLAAKLLTRASSLSVAPVTPQVAGAAATAVAAVRTTSAASELSEPSADSPDAMDAVSEPSLGTAYGDLLLALVASARTDGVDADVELRAAARRYRAKVRHAEGHRALH